MQDQIDFGQVFAVANTRNIHLLWDVYCSRHLCFLTRYRVWCWWSFSRHFPKSIYIHLKSKNEFWCILCLGVSVGSCCESSDILCLSHELWIYGYRDETCTARVSFCHALFLVSLLVMEYDHSYARVICGLSLTHPQRLPELARRFCFGKFLEYRIENMFRINDDLTLSILFLLILCFFFLLFSLFTPTFVLDLLVLLCPWWIMNQGMGDV